MSKTEHLTVDVLAYEICVSMTDAEDGRYMHPIPWTERLRIYDWQGDDYATTEAALSKLSMSVEPTCCKISDGAPLEPRAEEALRAFAPAVFEWGSVKRGQSKQNPTGELIAQVITAGIEWKLPPRAVPMDVGWTKVAALATHFLEENGGTPQAIFDSRVAASLLTRLDYVLTGLKFDLALKPKAFLPDTVKEIGYVPGRGGTRKDSGRGRREHRYYWPQRSGSRGWSLA